MGSVQNMGQKVKGGVQQVVGKVEEKMGSPLEGAVDTIRGKANVAAADMKNALQKAKG